MNFLTCSRNDKNIKNLCIMRAAATLLRMALQALCPSFNTNLFGNQVTSHNMIRMRTSAKISRISSPSGLALILTKLKNWRFLYQQEQSVQCTLGTQGTFKQLFQFANRDVIYLHEVCRLIAGFKNM